MAKTATVRARIEPSIKKKAEAVLRKIGMTPSEAINVFYHRVAADKAVPFSLHIPNAQTRKAIMDARAGKNLIGPFDSSEELFAHLLAKPQKRLRSTH